MTGKLIQAAHRFKPPKEEKVIYSALREELRSLQRRLIKSKEALLDAYLEDRKQVTIIKLTPNMEIE